MKEICHRSKEKSPSSRCWELIGKKVLKIPTGLCTTGQHHMKQARMPWIDSRLWTTKPTNTNQHRPTVVFCWIVWGLFTPPRSPPKSSEAQLHANCNLYVHTRLRCWEFKEIGYWYVQAALVPTSVHSPHWCNSSWDVWKSQDKKKK